MHTILALHRAFPVASRHSRVRASSTPRLVHRGPWRRRCSAAPLNQLPIIGDCGFPCARCRPRYSLVPQGEMGGQSQRVPGLRRLQVPLPDRRSWRLGSLRLRRAMRARQVWACSGQPRCQMAPYAQKVSGSVMLQVSGSCKGETASAVLPHRRSGAASVAKRFVSRLLERFGPHTPCIRARLPQIIERCVSSSS